MTIAPPFVSVTTLETGQAFATINPQADVNLGGFAGPERSWTNIQADLECNLLLVFDPSQTFALLSLDTLFAGPELTAAVQSLACTHLGATAHVQIFASHTHAAPMLDETKPLLGRASPTYRKAVLATINELFQSALKSRKGSMQFAHCSAQGAHGINRRLLAKWHQPQHFFAPRTELFLAPNAMGPVDNSVRCLLFRDREGKVIAAILQVACHPTGFPKSDAVSPDYVGPLRSLLRARFGPGLPVIFMQGFCGDVRPNIEGHLTARYLINRLRSGPMFRPVTVESWQAWVGRMCATLAEALSGISTWQRFEGALASHTFKIDTSQLTESPAHSTMLVLNRYVLGNAARLASVNAEMLAGWLDLFGEYDFTASCSNHCFGYLPREADAELGGYEAERFKRAFNLSFGRWIQGYENRIRQAWNLPGPTT